MKIKLFESFNQDDYYIKIDKSKWDTSSVLSKPFSKMDISRIRKINPNIKLGIFGHLMSGVFNNTSPSKEILIKLLEDDWYLVQILTLSYHSTLEYYKCDQIEGIKELLKDKDII